jgi:hypothetical protein
MKNTNGIAGQKIGRLTITGVYRNKWNNPRYIVMCDNGCEFNTSKKLLFGERPHCKICENNKSIEYRVWDSIIQRCYNKNRVEYKNYGGRGISVCKEWKTFLGFISTFQRRPSKEYSIERIDVNGNYKPSNCEWVRKSDNSRFNKRTTLTKKDVEEIRNFLARKFSIRKIALFFDIKERIIRNIKNNKTYNG